MKYIGNCHDKLNPEWLEEALTTDGELRPNEIFLKHIHLESKNDTLVKKWLELEFDKKKTICWRMYYPKINVKDLIDVSDNAICESWIVRLDPGKFFPAHIDKLADDDIFDIKRYWVALQDYKWGHLFVCKNKMLHEYKSGDIFEIDKNDLHGSGNIGLVPKVSLQLVCKNKKI
jgi:hypothetical protein